MRPLTCIAAPQFKHPVRKAPQQPGGSPSHEVRGAVRSVPFACNGAERCSCRLRSAGTTHLKVSQRPESLGRAPSMALLADILLIAFLKLGCVFRSKSTLGDAHVAGSPPSSNVLHVLHADAIAASALSLLRFTAFRPPSAARWVVALP